MRGDQRRNGGNSKTQEHEKGEKSKKESRKGGLLAEDNKDRGRPADLHMDGIPQFHSSTLKNDWQLREKPDDSFLDFSAGEMQSDRCFTPSVTEDLSFQSRLAAS